MFGKGITMKNFGLCVAMVLLQSSYGASVILVKVAFERGLNQFVFVAYRHIIAMFVLGPFAYVRERWAIRNNFFIDFCSIFPCRVVIEHSLSQPIALVEQNLFTFILLTYTVFGKQGTAPFTFMFTVCKNIFALITRDYHILQCLLFRFDIYFSNSSFCLEQCYP